MRGVLVLGIAALGCGRLGFESSSVTTSDTSGDGSDAPAVPDAGGMACLGTAHLVVDNFDDNFHDAVLWARAFSDTPTYFEEKLGRMKVVIGADVANIWGGYATAAKYDLRDDRMFVEVPGVPLQQAQAVLYAFTTANSSDGLGIEYESGRLYVRKRIADVVSDLKQVPYVAAQHRWWQIRERAGTMFWETSPDGVTWNILHMAPTLFDVSAVYLTITAGANTAQTAPGDAQFDNFNGGGSPPRCP